MTETTRNIIIGVGFLWGVVGSIILAARWLDALLMWWLWKDDDGLS